MAFPLYFTLHSHVLFLQFSLLLHYHDLFDVRRRIGLDDSDKLFETACPEKLKTIWSCIGCDSRAESS